MTARAPEPQGGSTARAMPALLRAASARVAQGERSLAGSFADRGQPHVLLDRLRDVGIPIVKPVD